MYPNDSFGKRSYDRGMRISCGSDGRFDDHRSPYGMDMRISSSIPSKMKASAKEKVDDFLLMDLPTNEISDDDPLKKIIDFQTDVSSLFVNALSGSLSEMKRATSAIKNCHYYTKPFRDAAITDAKLTASFNFATMITNGTAANLDDVFNS